MLIFSDSEELVPADAFKARRFLPMDESLHSIVMSKT